MSRRSKPISKEQAKDRRGVRITCRGDLVYIITAYTAFKLPSVLYADVIQPVTFRECPADGVTIISAQYGFEVEENAPDLVDIFKRHAPQRKARGAHAVLAGHSHRQKKSGLARLFPHRDNAHLDKCRLRQHGEPGAIHLSRHDARLFPVYAVVSTSDPTISVIMLPIKPTAEVETLCKKMFSE